MNNERIDLTQFEGHTEGPWKAGIDCPEDFEMGEPHEENFHFSLHEFHAVIPGTDAWRGARDGEWENPNEWHGYSERDPKQLRADVLLMAAGPDLLAELKRCYELIDMMNGNVPYVEHCEVCGATDGGEAEGCDYCGIIHYQSKPRGFYHKDSPKR